MTQDLEARLRNRLSETSLVYVSFPDNQEEVEELKRALNQLGRRAKTLPPGEQKRLILENQATYVLGVTYSAWENYSGGTLWPYIEDALGFPEIAQADLASYYRLSLSLLGLDLFQLRGKNAIGEILLHCGIPKNSQETFLEKLINETQRLGSLTAEEFVSSIRSLTKDKVLSKGFDVPTWTFIAQAPDLAIELTERCLEVIDDIAQDGVWDGDGSRGLPAPLLAAIVLKTKELSPVKRNLKNLRSLRRNPALFLDINNLELRLILPQLEEIYQREILWNVRSEDLSRTIRSAPELRGLEPRPIELPIEKLVPTVVIEASGLNLNWTQTIFDPQAPVLFFLSNGNELLDTEPLPAEQIFALAPLDNTADGFQFEMDDELVTNFQTYGTPSAWLTRPESSSWKIVSLDLSGRKVLRLLHGGSPRLSRKIGHTSVSFLLETAIVQGVKMEESDVFSALPLIHVTSMFAEQKEAWRVQLQLGSSISKKFEITESLEQYSGLDILGEAVDFSISVWGKRGAARKVRGFLVPGLHVEYSPQIRTINESGSGLEESNAKLSFLDGNTAKVQLGVLPQANHLMSAGFELAIRPPHVELEVLRNGEGTRHYQAAAFDPDELAGIQVSILLPSGQIQDVYAQDNGQEVQKLSVKNRNSKKPSINLGELADTVRQFNRLEVIAVYQNRRMRIASIQRKKLVNRCTLEPDGGILFDSSVPDSHLRVRLYPLHAPWIKPLDLKVDGNRFSLPNPLFGLGKIGLIFELIDPWLHSSLPETYGTATNAFLIDTKNLSSSNDSEKTLVRWFENGKEGNDLENLNSGLLARLLVDETIETEIRTRPKVTNLAIRLAEGRREQVFTELIKLSESFPRATLSAFFSLDLIHHVAPKSDLEPFRPASINPYFSLLGHREKLWSTQDNIETWCNAFYGYYPDAERLEDIPESLNMVDRNALLSNFTKRVSDLNFLQDPDAQLTARQRLGVVPAPPLHDLHFASIFLNLLAVRGKLESDSLVKLFLSSGGSENFIKEVRKKLPTDDQFSKKLMFSVSRPSTSLLEMGGNIALVMGVSMGLALAARYSNHQKELSDLYQTMKAQHQRLFQLVPDLVEHDLIVAELLASHYLHHGGK